MSDMEWIRRAFPCDSAAARPVRPPVEGRVDPANAALYIDGEKRAPLFFFGNTEARGHDPHVFTQIGMAARRGMHLHTFVIHFPVVPKGCRREFPQLERTMDKVLEADPQALCILRVPLYPHDALWWEETRHADELAYENGESGMQWWGRHHPEDLMRFSDGETSMPSVASDEWLTQAVDAIDAGIDHLMANPRYAPHIIGYHLTYNSTGEWFYMDYRERGADLCETNRRGFNRWLAQAYPGGLPESYGGVAPGGAAIPELPGNLRDAPGEVRGEVFVKDVRVTDFYRYINALMAHRIEQVAAFTKRKTQGRSLVMIFYGYTFELADPKSGHCALSAILDCPDIDMLASPVSYQDRAEKGVMAYMAPVDTIRLHGKLWMVEDDTRTFKAYDHDGNDGMFNPTIRDDAITYEIHRRNMAAVIPRQNGLWWMDLWGTGWLEDEAIWDNNRRLAELYARYDGAAFEPDVAVIVDDRATMALANPARHGYELIYRPNAPIYRAGVNLGLYNYDDAVNGRIPDSCRLYVFLNAHDVRLGEETRIRRHLMRDGKTVLYVLAPDALNGRATAALSGMALRTYALPECSDCCLAEGDGVETLARCEDGRPLLMAKDHGDYSTAVLGRPVLDAALLRMACRRAGVHIYGVTDDYWSISRGFVGLYTASEGIKIVTLPGMAKVTDLLTGEITVTDRLQASMAAHRAWLLAVEAL